MKPFWILLFASFGCYAASEVDRQAYLGRNDYLCGDYEAAFKHFQAAQAIDANHRIVSFYLPKVEALLQEKMNRERTATRTELLDAVDDAWQLPEEPSVPLNKLEHQGSRKLFKKLRGVQVEKVTFAEMPLSRVVEALTALSEELDKDKEGFNLVFMGGDKNPLVTISLKNLSFGRILELIVKSVGFQIDVENDAVLFRPEEAENTHLETDFFPIARGTVIRLLGLREERDKERTLEEEESLLKRFFTRAGISFDIPGSSLAFEGTQLIVTQTGRNLQRLSNILNRYRETRQVEIETKFLEVQQGALDEIGVRWNIGNPNNNQVRVATGSAITSATPASTDYDNLRTLNGAFSASSSTSGNGSIVSASGTTSIPNTAPTLPNALNLGAKSVALGNILGVISHYEVSALIRALEQKTGSDLMSAPKVTVLSGRCAEIVVAQEFRYPEKYGDVHSEVGTGTTVSGSSSAGVTITAGTPLNFITRNIGVEMKVTPTVEENQNINLLLEPCVTEFERFVEYGGQSVAISGTTTVQLPSGFYQPIFSTRKIKTEVSVSNGSTIVMGGLTREEVKDINDKVPFLGDIPGLGRLFRSKSQSSQKRNLLIFVTANTLYGQQSSATVR